MTLEEAIEALENEISCRKNTEYENDYTTEVLSFVLNYIENESISKEKIKEIIYPTPENYIPIEVQTSEMYSKLQELLGDD